MVNIPLREKNQRRSDRHFATERGPVSLYIIRNGAPCVMVKKKFGIGQRVASFCIDHAMVFEDHELLESSQEEFRFNSRDGKEYFFNAGDVRTLK